MDTKARKRWLPRALERLKQLIPLRDRDRHRLLLFPWAPFYYASIKRSIALKLVSDGEELSFSGQAFLDLPAEKEWPGMLVTLPPEARGGDQKDRFVPREVLTLR